MRNRTKRACQVCGKPFYGSTDCHYCPECAKIKRSDTVVKIRVCKDCGVEFFGGPRARRCPDCAYIAQQETSRRHKKSGSKRPLGSIDKCVICGAEYIVVSGRQKYCSDYCRKEQKKLHQCIADINRGYNRDYDKYIDKRNKYREQVKNEDK